jgi:hypothetical protein
VDRDKPGPIDVDRVIRRHIDHLWVCRSTTMTLLLSIVRFYLRLSFDTNAFSLP